MDSAQDPASQDAARWYARLRAPDCTIAERADFERWIAGDPRNAAAFAAAERIAEALTKLATIDPRLKSMVDHAASAGATLPDDEQEEPPARSPPPLTITAEPTRARGVRSRIAQPFAWAASAMAAVVSVLLLLTLDDGTRVYLDVASAIDLRFDAARRAVVLKQGRALFDAAYDRTRPFVVIVDTKRITALGTVFQVDREPSEIIVTLARGAVTVTNQSGDTAIPLAAGEELRSSAGGTRWLRRSVDAEAATSWSKLVLSSAAEAAERAQF